MTDKKLRIILINYRFFVSGGPERYMFNVIDLLESKGHEVIPFSIKHKINAPSKYEKYFMSPVGKKNEIYFGDQEKTNPSTILKLFFRMYYSFEAKKKLTKLIEDVKPDLIYVLYYQNKISPSIFDAAKKMNIPVVHRISDFGQICANVQFFRPKQKDVCERCMKGSKINAVVNKCVYDSYVYSALKAGSMAMAEHVFKIWNKIDAVVIPSAFTLKKFAEYGFPKHKLNYVPTFFNFNIKPDDATIEYKPFALFIGRVEKEKGLGTLIEAFLNTKMHLKVIGFSNTGFDEELKAYIKDKPHNIEFLGRKNFPEIVPYLQTCAFTVVPSECYDNFPNTILESYGFKKPVIATRIGSLIDMVDEGETGLLFNWKDHYHLREKAEILLSNMELCEEYGENGYQKVLNEYSEEAHYNKLIAIFYAVLQKQQKTIGV
ncbi:MAG TPA: glycosyltransferase family 4 protein [Ferruginibacter sp.]|nr:glycosyltransferase family 4 protein [Ferruginibacter sp.]HMP20190.1 glycosyltransferase family 4 protein [Ferruginibacter sp.]